MIGEHHTMPANYCPYCGRYMAMREFQHACDNVNRMRGYKGWCNRCGAPLNVGANDDMANALCHVCQMKIE